MSSNTFGRLFTFISFGESHGPALGCVVDGCPPLIPLAEGDVQPFLDRRRPGTGRHVSQRREADSVRILSGVFEGLTTGHPICLLVENRDQRPDDYRELREVFRPGHADATYSAKYGIRDHRGGGRASARETLARVAAGAVARKLLGSFPETAGIRVTAGLASLGGVAAEAWNAAAIDANPLFCPDPAAVAPMLSALEEAERAGDSLGGMVEIRATGVPPGLGEPVQDRLDARIAQACMGLNAVRGVEIGDGMAVAGASGRGNNDQMRSPAGGRLGDAFLSNHAGGVLGGISTGQPILVRVAVKPTPSISLPQLTVDENLKDIEISVSGRHDPAVAIRAVPVLEAMFWLILADFFLIRRALKGRGDGQG
ncbi:MAG: chorismate synthase [Planctomycetota bacterium]|jgi:chorismate synthase|nr:chorismate synthase [Planctomycetota bacterium]